MRLDVGCGHTPVGDVNVDLYKNPSTHRSRDQSKCEDYDLHAVPNLVVADAEHLPFKNNAFDYVYSNHVIEHVSNPEVMLREMVRVTKDIVHIKCPHRYASRKGMALHLNYFSCLWFYKTLRQLGMGILHGDISLWRYIPNQVFPLFRVPAEIEVISCKINEGMNNEP
jgi:ubiquinone/menaquinone biosynthesis C-methylase UbiE